jgi:hypothetical protein
VLVTQGAGVVDITPAWKTVGAMRTGATMWGEGSEARRSYPVFSRPSWGELVDGVVLVLELQHLERR